MSANDGQADLPPVKDPDDSEYNQQKALEQIWRAKTSIEERHDELSLKIGDTIPKERAEHIFHRILNHYLIVTHTLYIDTYPELGAATWTSIDIGTQEIDPPPHLTEDGDAFNVTVLDGATPEYREFEGLKSLLNTPPLADIEFKAKVRQRHKGVKTERETKTVTVPWNTLNTAWMATEAFMNRIGLGADTGGMVDSSPDDLI